MIIKIIIALAVVVAVSSTLAGASILINNAGIVNEIAECEDWEQVGLTAIDYYLTDWQIAQCEVVAPYTLVDKDYLTY